MRLPEKERGRRGGRRPHRGLTSSDDGRVNLRYPRAVYIILRCNFRTARVYSRGDASAPSMAAWATRRCAVGAGRRGSAAGLADLGAFPNRRSGDSAA